MSSETERRAIERQALRVAKLRGKSKVEHALVLADMIEQYGYPTNPNGGVPTGRRAKPADFDVFGLDVWGNRRDGYEIDQVFRTGDTIRVPMVEVLHNVLAFAHRTTKPRPTAFAISGTASPFMLFTRAQTAAGLPMSEVLRKVVRRRFVPSGTVRVEGLVEGFYEVSRVRDGRPLLHLQERT